jgi:phosphoribosylaminoimidazole-succinocarboxamide synthase
MGVEVAQGKTKIIEDIGDGEVLVRSKDDITAGDGLKHDILEGKAAASTRTTCNVFELLERHGVPTHFIVGVDERTFKAVHVDMIPLELVARRFATGSYRKRHPEVAEDAVFDDLCFEIFEKDDTLSPPEAGDDTMNDPFVEFDFDAGVMRRWKPKRPRDVGFIDERPIAETPFANVTPELVEELRELTLRVFSILEDAWDRLDGVLIDFKIECGFDRTTGALLVADVIDSDSWRLRFGEVGKDKQAYREGTKSLPEIKKDYEEVAELTDRFAKAV